MKPIKISFLFFLLSLLCFNKRIEAQNNTDSTHFYVKSITSSKKNNDVVNAILYLQNLNNLHKKDDNTLALVYNLTYIASAQKKIGFIYEAEKTAIEAIKLLDQIEGKNNDYRIPLNNFLGNLYLEYEDYNTSLEYYNLVLDLNNNSENRVTIINNIGKVYLEQKDYNSAIEFFKESYLNSLNFNKKENTARALDNLGFAQSKIENPDALTSLTEAMEIRLKLNYIPGIIESYIHLGEYYKDRNDKIKALEYANKAIVVAEASGNSDYLLNTLLFYSELNTDSKILKLRKLEDSVKKSVSKIKNQYTAKRYDFEKKEQELKDTKIIKERIVISFIFIFLITIFFQLYQKSKHKKEKLQQVYKTESRISKKVHDEIANDVFQVMTNLEVETDINSNLKSDIEHIYDKARDISKQLGELNITGDFKIILNDLAINYTNSDTNVILKDVSKIQWEKVSDIKKTALYKVLQELLINMKKHSKASIAVITFNSSSKKIIINYKDDGIGCHLKKSNGLLNVENRINAISGTINFESEINKGFKAIIEV
ncbi:tetratricopeptide repeat-containing sensor histidine kinase [uncultured Winogradskyella sp.]|uniref:tetratricopeptide repeat-containing sensor histidine kinase n=1 Tax=uncultured Winogradskyella sp. TaxID=395353 RepID=UPI002632F964|nr:tetratricopeptide repeat-containing sensor histidine kinase [uncultured Winogradskyella sp.]